MSEKKIFKEIDKDWADQQEIDRYCAEVKRSLNETMIPMVEAYLLNAKGETKNQLQDILSELREHEKWFRLGRSAKDTVTQMKKLRTTTDRFGKLQKRGLSL
jgi:hypothetical protein